MLGGENPEKEVQISVTTPPDPPELSRKAGVIPGVTIHRNERLMGELRQRRATPLGRAKLRERVAVEQSLTHPLVTGGRQQSFSLPGHPQQPVQLLCQPCLSNLILQLIVNQRSVIPAPGKEFLMRTSFDNRPVVKHENHVGISDGA